MKKNHFAPILALLLIAVSCKKDEGGSTPAAVKFMSLTAGSTWKYKLTNNTTGAATPYTVTATANDSIANGRTYKVFTNSAGSNEYYNITGSDYYTFRRFKISSIDTSLEVLYFKDNLDVNGTWSQTIPVNYLGFALQLTLNNKIAEKGITKIVNGTTYNNVTKVETTLTVTGIPALIPYTLTSDIQYYYAPKFGQIENKTKIDFTISGTTSSIDQKTELESATIL